MSLKGVSSTVLQSYNMHNKKVNVIRAAKLNMKFAKAINKTIKSSDHLGFYQNRLMFISFQLLGLKSQ